MDIWLRQQEERNYENLHLRTEATRVIMLRRRACQWLQEQVALVVGMERMACTSAEESCIHVGQLRQQCDELRVATLIRHTNGNIMKDAIAGVAQAEEAVHKSVEVGHCETELLRDECKSLQQHAASVASMDEDANKLIQSLLCQIERSQEDFANLKRKRDLGDFKMDDVVLPKDLRVSRQLWAQEPVDMARTQFQDAKDEFQKSADLAIELRHMLQQVQGSKTDKGVGSVVHFGRSPLLTS